VTAACRRFRRGAFVAHLAAVAAAWALGQAPLSSPPARLSETTTLQRDNVAELQLAWARSLAFEGRVTGPPAFADGALFVSTDSGIVSLDVTTGETVWSYAEERVTGGLGAVRRAPRGTPIVLQGRVIASLPTRPAVAAIDAATGEPIWIREVASADAGAILSSNPTLAGDIVVVGPTGADLSPIAGRLVALDVRDGSIVWEFDLVPVREDDPARTTWGPMAPSPSFGIGGGTAWNVGAYDATHDIVLFGTGQPVPTDRLDPRRYEEEGVTRDLYTASFVALHAKDGALAWFHQVVPGDEWEYDQHTVPIVADLSIEDAARRVALLATTTGFLLVVDVATGERLADHLMVPFGTVHLGYASDGAPIIDEAARRTSSDETIRVCPGARWASVAPGAFSPALGLVYRPNEWSCVRRGATSAPDEWVPGSRALWLQSDARSEEDFFDRWGALTAIDPVTGEVAWEFTTPYRHDAGVVVTASDLVISAFADRAVRIFDAATGDVLWTYVLPTHSDATPLLFDVAGVPHLAVLAGRDVGVPALPASGLPPSVAGTASLFVFRLE